MIDCFWSLNLFIERDTFLKADIEIFRFSFLILFDHKNTNKNSFTQKTTDFRQKKKWKKTIKEINNFKMIPSISKRRMNFNV